MLFPFAKSGFLFCKKKPHSNFQGRFWACSTAWSPKKLGTSILSFVVYVKCKDTKLVEKYHNFLKLHRPSKNFSIFVPPQPIPLSCSSSLPFLLNFCFLFLSRLLCKQPCYWKLSPLCIFLWKMSLFSIPNLPSKTSVSLSLSSLLHVSCLLFLLLTPAT